jgi:four helix bundle protein
MAKREMRGLENLECYQLASEVMREAYRTAESLPPHEKYKLADQLRRAAIGGVLNITEAYGQYTYLDCLRFYHQARESLTETLNAMMACEELRYISAEIPRQRELCHVALRSLDGYIGYVRGQQQGKYEYGEKLVREGGDGYQMDDLSTEA